MCAASAPADFDDLPHYDADERQLLDHLANPHDENFEPELRGETNAWRRSVRNALRLWVCSDCLIRTAFLTFAPFQSKPDAVTLLDHRSLVFGADSRQGPYRRMPGY